MDHENNSLRNDKRNLFLVVFFLGVFHAKYAIYVLSCLARKRNAMQCDKSKRRKASTGACYANELLSKNNFIFFSNVMGNGLASCCCCCSDKCILYIYANEAHRKLNRKFVCNLAPSVFVAAQHKKERMNCTLIHSVKCTAGFHR